MKSAINSSSFFILIISWSLLLLSHFVVGSNLNSEGEALLSMFMNGFSSDSNTTTPCDWSGVGCNTQNTHVVSLKPSRYISGQLGPQIGQLTYLKSLDLSHNNFNGPIPTELWNCSHLQYLDLSFNSFSGELPEAVKNLHNLKTFTISTNQLSGRIPVSLFHISGLESVDLSYNNFTGSILTELSNCSHLQYLELSENDFTGEFPHEAAMRNLHQLKTFSIYRNRFSGRIPEYLFHQNSGLETVILSWNNFTGSIPVNIGNATNMKFLGLGANQLHGSIPSSITNCTKLEALDLSKNNLSGELPVDMTTELRLLKRIYLRENRFFGSVPKDLGIKNTHLEEVDFSNNAFSGEIPPNLCFGQKLTDMNLNLNQFHGNIPSSYTRNCDSLTKLTLQGNNLIVSLPHFAQINNRQPTHDLQWTKFQSLVLDLSRNKFYGQIPSSICSRFYLSELDLSNNQMNGSLPHYLGGGHAYLKIVNLRNNNLIQWYNLMGIYKS